MLQTLSQLIYHSWRGGYTHPDVLKLTLAVEENTGREENCMSRSNLAEGEGLQSLICRKNHNERFRFICGVLPPCLIERSCESPMQVSLSSHPLTIPAASETLDFYISWSGFVEVQRKGPDDSCGKLVS